MHCLAVIRTFARSVEPQDSATPVRGLQPGRVALDPRTFGGVACPGWGWRAHPGFRCEKPVGRGRASSLIGTLRGPEPPLPGPLPQGVRGTRKAFPLPVVIVPTFNEAGNIRRLLHELLDPPSTLEVIVVDDSSPDGTADIVRRCMAERSDARLGLLVRPGKEGLGAAYRDGFRAALAAGHDVVVQMDADGSHPVREIAPMTALLDAGADLVVGSRYIPGGGIEGSWAWHRRMLSRGGNLYARVMLSSPVHDLTGGFKAWRADVLRTVVLGEAPAAGYAFQVQTTALAQAAGARVVEHPILFGERRSGTSKMHAGIVLEAIGAILGLRGRVRDARDSSRPAVAGPGGWRP